MQVLYKCSTTNMPLFVRVCSKCNFGDMSLKSLHYTESECKTGVCWKCVDKSVKYQIVDSYPLVSVQQHRGCGNSCRQCMKRHDSLFTVDMEGMGSQNGGSLLYCGGCLKIKYPNNRIAQDTTAILSYRKMPVKKEKCTECSYAPKTTIHVVSDSALRQPKLCWQCLKNKASKEGLNLKQI